ncbi:MAG: DUF2905 domain-containing protein [Anaerolineales bacterium]|nr:DUF2905 domain-containing protein [Anaerolineales bacterium]
MMETLARVLMILGVVIFVVGGVLYLSARLNLPLGRLPGDIHIERENLTCIFPIVTMILVSVILTVVLNLVIRLLNK